MQAGTSPQVDSQHNEMASASVFMYMYALSTLNELTIAIIMHSDR